MLYVYIILNILTKKIHSPIYNASYMNRNAYASYVRIILIALESPYQTSISSLLCFFIIYKTKFVTNLKFPFSIYFSNIVPSNINIFLIVLLFGTFVIAFGIFFDRAKLHLINS
jgi:hypothetical protein